MDKNKQTAVEWLEEQRKWSVITNEHIEQAKAFEKQQIIDANNMGYSAGRRDLDETAEQYYNSTYGE
jgi:hypothetical protein